MERSVTTPRGEARVHLDRPDRPRALLLLGHGANGGVDAPDLVAVTEAVGALSVAVGRVTQPYRVAGKRSPAPAGHLDEAWIAVATALRDEFGPLPLVVGGRSSGARVACRTAAVLDAIGAVALAFPTRVPGKPDKDRTPELDIPGVPVLVVSGERDPYGAPEPAPGRIVRVIPGADHGLARVRDAGPVTAAVVDWLGDVL